MYLSYSSALAMCGLENIYDRRQKRCLDFALKSAKHPRNQKMFPLNQVKHEHKIRGTENTK